MEKSGKFVGGAVALSILASAACSSEVEMPESSVPTIEHSAPYKTEEEQALYRITGTLLMPELAALGISDHYQIKTTVSETDILALDDYELDKDYLKETIEFLETYVAGLGVTELKITTANAQTHSVSTLNGLNTATTHGVLIVPPTIDTTSSIAGAHGSFTYTPNDSETFSIVINDPEYSPIAAIPKFESNFATELCQAIAWVRARDEDIAKFGPNMTIVAQEAFCNGVGRALASVKLGLSYSEYLSAYGSQKLQAGDLTAELFVVDEATYMSMPINY